MEIVATIGGQVAKGFSERPGDVAYRANGLKLQKTAVEAVLAKAPQLAEQWRPTLGLLASGWIVEASHSYANSQSDSLGMVLERDDFGNVFYTQRRRGGGGQVQPIEPADLVESQPGAAWVALLPRRCSRTSPPSRRSCTSRSTSRRRPSRSSSSSARLRCCLLRVSGMPLARWSKPNMNM